jgi:transposase
VDSTTASGYWTVTEDGYFQLGHSKDHRPDLPQVKVNLSTLDPMGMPLVTQVLPGNAADDPLYIPAIEAVKESIRESGLLYIGDCKMAALATRAFISKGENFYLCPLSALQFSSEQLDIELARALTGQEPLIPIYREDSDGEVKLIAEGFELSEIIRTEVDGEKHIWEERRLIIRSLSLTDAQERHFDKRLSKAEAELQAINERKRGKKRPRNVEEIKT